jgi:hypothetical protein
LLPLNQQHKQSILNDEETSLKSILIGQSTNLTSKAAAGDLIGEENRIWVLMTFSPTKNDHN